MDKSQEPRLFDYGLDAAQEERAQRIHGESIIIDMLYQGPVAAAAYTEEMVKRVIKGFDVKGSTAIDSTCSRSTYRLGFKVFF